MGFMGSWFVTSVACAAAIWLVPGIQSVGGSWAGPIFCALALAFVNAIIKPVAQFFAFPLTLLTLGIFQLVINAFMLELASSLSRNVFHAGIYIESFGAAVMGAIVMSLAGMLVSGVTGIAR